MFSSSIKSPIQAEITPNSQEVVYQVSDIENEHKQPRKGRLQKRALLLEFAIVVLMASARLGKNLHLNQDSVPWIRAVTAAKYSTAPVVGKTAPRWQLDLMHGK